MNSCLVLLLRPIVVSSISRLFLIVAFHFVSFRTFVVSVDRIETAAGFDMGSRARKKKFIKAIRMADTERNRTKTSSEKKTNGRCSIDDGAAGAALRTTSQQTLSFNHFLF